MKKIYAVMIINFAGVARIDKAFYDYKEAKAYCDKQNKKAVFRLSSYYIEIAEIK